MSAETSSKFKKLQKKVRLAIGKSKKHKDNDETLGSRKKGFQGYKKAQITMEDGVDVSYKDGKLIKRENNGRRNTKFKAKDKQIHTAQEGYGTKVDGNSAFKQFNSDRKRKRIYADRGNGKEVMFKKNVEKSNRKVPLSREGWNEPKDYHLKEKRTAKWKSRDFEPSNNRHLNARANELLDRNGGKKFRGKMKATNKVESDRTDVARNSLLKKDAKSQFGRNLNMLKYESLEKFDKKKFHDKKRLDDESAVTPMKTKRVIRIDPRDITNKRLDDGIITNENTKEKKEDLKKNESVEMSMNAQFRAIQPTPSILSFVEENLLGRRRSNELRRAGYNIELSAPLDNVPFSTSSERKRIEDAIFRNKLSFFAAAKISSSFPPPDIPEIAFAGRSNVGKSSLINALTRQWGVVRTSDKPGLTQTINFFKLGPKLCLVDLPGYGFAYAKEEVKEAWEELVKEYVSTRVGLKQVCLIVDTKWGMKPRDYELVGLMERSQTKYQILLTKTDLVSPIDVARRAMQIEESLKAKKSAIPPVMMVSSKSGAGVRSLRTVLAKIARFAKV
ncbi:uncharacterized protein LOC132269270 isoform X2 [Cornus florida]|uniref:uncharacterized protein LOC132269270 isoform X2 n=1 Tax=Cornus florida TaxID=4283 RepID=UPI00289CDEC0|nr:uncharacterized protein LOC132269270 isoform X2 [Cornus florida]